jgi:hypothetical protein
MARRLPVPKLRRWSVVAGARRAAGVCGKWLPNLSDSGDDLPGYEDPFAGLVPHDVVADDPEERCQRVGIAASARLDEI